MRGRRLWWAGGILGALLLVFAWWNDFAILWKESESSCTYLVPFRMLHLTKMSSSGGPADITCLSIGLPDDLVRMNERLERR